MKKKYYLELIAVLVISLLSGCAFNVETNIPDGVQKLPKGYGLVYGSISLPQANKTKVYNSGYGDAEIRLVQGNNVLFKKDLPWRGTANTCFSYMVPEGNVNIEITLKKLIALTHDSTVSTGLRSFKTTVWSYFDPRDYCFTKSVYVPADTAVYVGKLLYLDEHHDEVTAVFTADFVDKCWIQTFDAFDWLKKTWQFATVKDYYSNIEPFYEMDVRSHMQLNRNNYLEFYMNLLSICTSSTKDLTPFSPEWVKPVSPTLQKLDKPIEIQEDVEK